MNRSILLISKNETAMARLSRALRHGNYEVTAVCDEKKALHFFHGTTVDAVIVDLSDDSRTAKRLKEMNQFVPVICLVNRANADSAGEWVDAWITRPVEIGNLLRLLDRFVNETVEERLERVCGNDQSCRFAAGFYTPFFNRLEQRREFNDTGPAWIDKESRAQHGAMAG